jgi:hypothetical protein
MCPKEKRAPAWLATTSVGGQRPVPVRRSKGWLVYGRVAANPGPYLSSMFVCLLAAGCG